MKKTVTILKDSNSGDKIMTINWLALVMSGIFLFLAVRSFKDMMQLKLLFYGHRPGVLVFVSELLFFIMVVMFVVAGIDFLSTSSFVATAG